MPCNFCKAVSVCRAEWLSDSQQYLSAELSFPCGWHSRAAEKGEALPGCRMREVDVKDILDALQLKHDQNSERPAHST